VATLRTLLGVCSVLLSNFKTTLEDDEALLGLGGSPGGAEGGRGGAAGSPQLGEELRAAVAFRADRKRTLARVIRALGSRARVVAGMAGLRDGPAAAQAKKGERPRPATDRGFAPGGGGGGGGRPRSGGGK
jgi:hypothetical protein